MKVRILLGLIGMVVVLGLTLSEVMAEQIVVTDCQGNARTSGKIEAGDRGVVKATFSYPESFDQVIVKAQIKESSSGLTDSVRIVNQTAVFDSVVGGVWMLCTAPRDLTLEDVVIETRSRRKGALRLAALGGVGAVLGGIAWGRNNDSSGGSEDPTILRETPAEVSVEPAEEEPAVVRPVAAEPPEKPKVDISHPCAQKAAATGLPCFIDDEPTPLSPFR